MELKITAALLTLVTATAPVAAQQTYDVVIHGGRIVDGTGSHGMPATSESRTARSSRSAGSNPLLDAAPSMPPAKW
jgi:hypothetical protein